MIAQANLAIDDVAKAPAGGCAERQHEAEQGQVTLAMGGDEIESCARQWQRYPVMGLPALPQPEHGEQQGEHSYNFV